MEKISSYREYDIYQTKGGWIAKSKRYEQLYGMPSKADKETLVKTAIKKLGEVYSKQDDSKWEQLKEKA